jgi:hypothetical protein
MRIAVVGGGIFGCAVALDLAGAGLDVELFEADVDILHGATSKNMARLHSGYHYPRSAATAAASRDAAGLFLARWPEAVRHARHWYAIAPGSKVSPEDYLTFLDAVGLPYTEVPLKDVPHLHTADMAIQAEEALIDVDQLRRLLRRDLARAGVPLNLKRYVFVPEVPGFDVTVWTTYGIPWSRPLRYEVCEVALLELGRYTDDSFVVLDGDYVSLDPHGRLYTLYDVYHSVHFAHTGTWPGIPREYQDLVNRPGPVFSPLSHLDRMIDSASRFLWGLHPDGGHVSIYHGSLWSVRAVLPDVDATDARPTLVKRDGNIVQVLSGKIGTAATVGQQVLSVLVDQASEIQVS